MPETTAEHTQRPERTPRELYTFTYTFEPDGVTLTYKEAVPPRDETVEMPIENYANTKDFLRVVGAHVEKINLFFGHLGLIEKISLD